MNIENKQQPLTNTCCGLLEVYNRYRETFDKILKENKIKEKNWEMVWLGASSLFFEILDEFRFDIMDCSKCVEFMKREGNEWLLNSWIEEEKKSQQLIIIHDS